MKHSPLPVPKLLLLILLAVLALPIIQVKYHLIELKPLGGAITEPTRAYLNPQDWFSGNYQEIQEKYLNDKFGFRNFLVRLNNQIAYTLFRKAKANNVLTGKENYLFEESYLQAYCGLDYEGYDRIYRRMKQLKTIQDSLWVRNKNLIVVFAAGKASFFPEYFPAKYTRQKDTSNYETHAQLAEALHVDHIDFNRYFVNQKYVSPYPLFGQFGIHWSYYGMCLVADSLIRYMEHKRHIDMPNAYWTEIELHQPRGGDYDIGNGLNILRHFKSYDMAYPNIRFESDTNKTRPSLLVISDSFYWGIYDFGFTQAFQNSHFWFYNHLVFPESHTCPVETSQLDLSEEISRHDVIILMATEATLSNLGWGFIEKAYDLFHPQTGNE